MRPVGRSRPAVGRANTAVTHAYRNGHAPWRNERVRLNTRWTLAFPRQPVSATFGDALTGFLDWTRRVRSGRMRHANGLDAVDYQSYRAPARTLPWGNAADVDTLGGIGTGAPQNVTVHGRVPTGQAVPAGRCSDVVTVTVAY